jgi:hypothetical protein
MARQRNVGIIDPVTSTGIIETNTLSWGAIWGGLFVSIGIFVLLNLLGMAIGLAVLDPFQGDSLRDVGIGAAVWAVVVQILALLVGGIVAARQAGIVDRFTGVLHGFVLWGFVTVFSMGFSFMLLGSAMDMGARAVSAGAEAVPGVVQRSAAGIDSSTLLQPINDQLRQQGRPELTANQLEAAVQGAAQRAMQEGRLDREIVVLSISENTNLSRQDAMIVAGRIEQEIAQAQRQAGDTAEDVSDAASVGFWGLFFASLLGLVAAVVGAMIGVSRRMRRIDRGVPGAPHVEEAPPPMVPPREVHP